MRAILISALVLVAALAGCSGKKADDDHLHYTCPDGTEVHADEYEGVLENITIDFLKTKCPKASGSGTGTKTNTTAPAPNILPTLVLSVTNFEGNATNVTFVDGNLTFDAAGSFDPDGQVTAIAIQVKDSNRTQIKNLYDSTKKVFTPATFSFDRPGVVNVSVAMVDDRAGFASLNTFAYVNQIQAIGSGSLRVPASQAPSQLAHPCQGASATITNGSGPIVHGEYFKEFDVAIVNGATFIEVTPNADNRVTICAPDGTAISAEKSGDPITSNNAEPLATATATDNYFVGFYVSTANAALGATAVVHYEPRPAAA